MVDMRGAQQLNPLENPDFLEGLKRYGGHVVVLDARGLVVARSEAWIGPFPLSLAPDEGRFVFLGVPEGRPAEEEGVYLTKFRGKEARRLVSLPQWRRNGDDAGVSAMLDWSPDGNSILLSGRGRVLVINAETGQWRKVAEGGSAQWSPSGQWVSYVTPNMEATLLNVANGETRRIDQGHEVLSAVEWSPDGKYVLLREGQGSHVPYGCLWVYRITDGAFVPIPYYGMAAPHPHWIQLDDGESEVPKQ